MTTPRPRLRQAPVPTPEGAIRVTYLIDSLGHGGAEQLLVRYLAAVPALGVEPRVVVIQDRDGNPMAADITALGVPVDSLDIDRLRRRGALDRVTTALASTAPDLIHTQLEFANILGTLAARRLGVPAIATLHTLDRPAPWSRDAARYRLMAWVLRRRSSGVVAVSASAAAHFRMRSGADSRLLSTIHNGIDLTPFHAAAAASDRDGVRREFGIPLDASLITTVALLRPEKGIADMLTALPDVLAHHPAAHYLVVGDGEARSALGQATEALGVAARVRFAGHRRDVARLLAASDVFVLPSHTEALPTVLIEAMASGVPIVATSVGGIPEMVDHGVSALLVPPAEPGRLADAVNRLLAAPLQAVAMAQAGRRAAGERFDLARQSARLVAEYRRLIARGAP